jgi:hypothetical protein
MKRINMGGISGLVDGRGSGIFGLPDGNILSVARDVLPIVEFPSRRKRGFFDQDKYVDIDLFDDFEDKAVIVNNRDEDIGTFSRRNGISSEVLQFTNPFLRGSRVPSGSSLFLPMNGTEVAQVNDGIANHNRLKEQAEEHNATRPEERVIWVEIMKQKQEKRESSNNEDLYDQLYDFGKRQFQDQFGKGAFKRILKKVGGHAWSILGFPDDAHAPTMDPDKIIIFAPKPEKKD